MSVKVAAQNVHLVEVRLKPEFLDAEGAAALALLKEQGLSSLKEVRCGRLYELKGALTANQAHQAGRDVLCDAVTQEFKVVPAGGDSFMNGMNSWRVEVWLKTGVSDPVGETVANAVAEAGLPKPIARCAALYRLNGRAMKPQIEKAFSRSLANPLIHRVVVTEAHP